MDSLLKNANTAEWWLSVVVVGVAVNVLSAALIYLVPRALAKLGSRWQQRSAQSRKAREFLLKRLVESDEEFCYFGHRQSELRFDILFTEVTSILLLTFGLLSPGSTGAMHVVSLFFAIALGLVGLTQILKHTQRAKLYQDASLMRREREYQRMAHQ